LTKNRIICRGNQKLKKRELISVLVLLEQFLQKYIMLRYYFIMRSLISIEMLLKERKQLKNWHKDQIEVYKTKQSRIKRFIFEFINVAQDEILK
jgi:hypothetical protein